MILTQRDIIRTHARAATRQEHSRAAGDEAEEVARRGAVHGAVVAGVDRIEQFSHLLCLLCTCLHCSTCRLQLLIAGWPCPRVQRRVDVVMMSHRISARGAQ